MAETVGRVCEVGGCGRPHRARGLCSTCYNQHHQPDRHRTVAVPCGWCGRPAAKEPTRRRRYIEVFCSLTCRDACRSSWSVPSWKACRCGVKWFKAGRATELCFDCADRLDLRSRLRRALEDGDAADVIAAIRADCKVDDFGCWVWQRKLSKDGYPSVKVAEKYPQVHRLSLEAKLGRPLGKQAVHHVCAKASCVNPDHLQPVTAAANSAEMLARTYMVQRIRDLEDALREALPMHPLLAEIGVVG